MYVYVFLNELCKIVTFIQKRMFLCIEGKTMYFHFTNSLPSDGHIKQDVWNVKKTYNCITQ